MGRALYPATVPAVRDWRPEHGEFRLPERPRIVIADPALRDEAETFAADLRSLTGRRSEVAHAGSTRQGDVLLSLGDDDPQLGDEGYHLHADESLRITGTTPTGAFWGTRTLLQLVRHGRSIPRGDARDWPRYPERGLMVDNGRKYFPPGWIEREIRQLSYLKLNRLHLHFSDNEGFRIASRSHPEIVSSPRLTCRQVRHLVSVGERYHVKLVPEIDMPGHMRAALAAHPELQLADRRGSRAPEKLDYTKPSAQEFAKDLIREYMDLFPADEWHLGADEFVSPADYGRYPQLTDYARATHGPDATPHDGFLGFINSINDLARRRGKRLRVWNDALGGGRVVTLDPRIVVEWWTNPAGPGSRPGPQDLIERGHDVLNAGWFPTYYVAGSSSQPDMTWAYEDWDVNVFFGAHHPSRAPREPDFALSPDEPKNLGSELHVWNDDPNAETEAEVAQAIAPRLRVLAQKTWRSPPLADDFATFERIARGVGPAAGA